MKLDLRRNFVSTDVNFHNVHGVKDAIKVGQDSDHGNLSIAMHDLEEKVYKIMIDQPQPPFMPLLEVDGMVWD